MTPHDTYDDTLHAARFIPQTLQLCYLLADMAMFTLYIDNKTNNSKYQSD